MSKLGTLKRCPANVAGKKECGSPVFYDWGLELLDEAGFTSIRGGNQERYRDYAGRNHVKICVRCTSPYILEGGELIDISEELSAEDVKAVLARGQALSPPPAVKDP